MPESNALADLLMRIPGIGGRVRAARSMRDGNPWAALGLLAPGLYDARHGGNPIENLGDRFSHMGDNFGDALGSLRGMFGGQPFDPSRMEAHQRGDPFDFDPTQFNETSQQRFDEAMQRRNDPRMPQVTVPGRSGASGSGQSAGSNTIATGVNAQRMFEAMRAGQNDQSGAAKQAMAVMFRGAAR